MALPQGPPPPPPELSAGQRRFAPGLRASPALTRLRRARGSTILAPDVRSDDRGRRALLDSFEHFEHHDLGAGTHERLLAVADELARHYGVKLAAERASAAAPHACGHRWP